VTIATTLRDLEQIAEPLARLEAIEKAGVELESMGADLRRLKGQAIRDLRGDGETRRTWAEVGDLLGVSAQRAEQLSRL